MASRRGAVRVNPVTGKMEKFEPTALPEGKHRDGCLVVDDRYVNAAKDLGLGAEKGMYSHIKGLARMDAGDVPVGTSMATDSGAGRGAAAPAATGWGAKGGELLKTGPSAVATAVAEGIRTAPKGVGAGNVHGFASKASGGSKLHNHEDAFQRRKGVVNTVGGAKDVTRVVKDEPPTLPPKGERKAQIMGFDLLDQHSLEGKARREAAAKREAAGGGHKMTMVQVTGGGGRSQASARYGGLPPTMAKMPGKEPPKASRVVGLGKLEGGGGVLGSSSSVNSNGGGSSAAGAASRGSAGSLGASAVAAAAPAAGAAAARAPPNAAAAARAAFFEKKFAEEKARKEASSLAAGLLKPAEAL